MVRTTPSYELKGQSNARHEEPQHVFLAILAISQFQAYPTLLPSVFCFMPDVTQGHTSLVLGVEVLLAESWHCVMWYWGSKQASWTQTICSNSLSSLFCPLWRHNCFGFVFCKIWILQTLLLFQFGVILFFLEVFGLGFELGKCSMFLYIQLCSGLLFLIVYSVITPKRVEGPEFECARQAAFLLCYLSTAP